ncbi:MAG: hypothetical protein NZ700_17100 [Gemmataceae bacterium]|nr:hypothetical protein [Gemmataceae bacterium]MDW8264119.1 hypothetical protein [Gemmataceae bacterium]
MGADRSLRWSGIRALSVSALGHGLLLLATWAWPVGEAAVSDAAVDTRVPDSTPEAGGVLTLADVPVVTLRPTVEPPPRTAAALATSVRPEIWSPLVRGAATAHTIADRPVDGLDGQPDGGSGEKPGARGAAAGGRASSGGLTTFFDVPAQGRSVVYVIDRSASMGQHGRLSAARRELRRSLEQLPETALFQILVYNRHVEPLRINGRASLWLASPSHKECAFAFLDVLVPEGGTEHLPALRAALALHADVIYYLTDADDLRPEDVRLITALNRGRSAIHAIELTARHRCHEDMPLRRLARENRGTYLGVDLTSP